MNDVESLRVTMYEAVRIVQATADTIERSRMECAGAIQWVVSAASSSNDMGLSGALDMTHAALTNGMQPTIDAMRNGAAEIERYANRL